MENNKEKHNSYMREWNKKNNDKKRDIDKKWRNSNKGKKYQEENGKKNNKLYNDINRFGGNRDLVLERDNWACIKCGMTQEQHIVIFSRGLTIDHKDGNGRYSKEPNNCLENLQTLCLRCHGIKDIKRKKI